jgi:hypothetical protein
MYQMAVKYSKWPKKYTDIFHSKAFQNSSKLGLLDRNYTIWQP